MITFGLKAHIRTKDVYRDETKAFFFLSTLYSSRKPCIGRYVTIGISECYFFYWENTWTGSLLPSFPHPGQDISP